MEIKVDISTVATMVDMMLNGPGPLEKPTHAFVLVIIPDIHDTTSGSDTIGAVVMSNLVPEAAANAIREVLKTNLNDDWQRPN